MTYIHLPPRIQQGSFPEEGDALFATFAYTLMKRLCAVALQGTEQLARSQTATIRVKLFKIGASVTLNTRRILILTASHYHEKATFLTVPRALAP